jgi:uncharacterized protein YprB with RNaseH-like and TPR domain
MATVYLDIETSGLKANEGRIVAIGIMKGESPEVRYAASLDEETALLDWLRRELEGCETLVTWNGSSFDIPFILSRAAFHRMNMGRLLRLPSLDLYEWSKAHLLLSSHRLEAVARFLGINAIGSFHGGDVPSLCKLADMGDAEAKRIVVEHCREDLMLLKRVHERLRPLVEGSGWMLPSPVVGGRSSE